MADYYETQKGVVTLPPEAEHDLAVRAKVIAELDGGRDIADIENEFAAARRAAQEAAEREAAKSQAKAEKPKASKREEK